MAQREFFKKGPVAHATSPFLVVSGQQMAFTLKCFAANYKLLTINYKFKGTTHDDIVLHAAVPFLVASDAGRRSANHNPLMTI